MLWFPSFGPQNQIPSLHYSSQSTKPPVHWCSWNKTKLKIFSDTGRSPREELGDCSIRNLLLPIWGIPKRCSFGCHKQLVLLSLKRSPAAEMQLPALFQAMHTWRNKHISTPTSLAVKRQKIENSTTLVWMMAHSWSYKESQVIKKQGYKCEQNQDLKVPIAFGLIVYTYTTIAACCFILEIALKIPVWPYF